MGWGLNRAFEHSVLNAAKDALRNQVLLLISGLDVVDGEVEMPAVPAEPRLTQVDSSLFAQVLAADGRVIWRSTSLLDRTLPFQNSEQGQFLFMPDKDWQDNDMIYSMTLGVEWETQGQTIPLVVQVAEFATVYQKRLNRYQRQMSIWLIVLGGVLIVLLLSVLGWVLMPLEKVAQQVGQIEGGDRRRFDEDYPEEVSRLTQNLNQLLNSEEKRISRQKEVLGNLAHSLKTPLAVLKGLKFIGEAKQEADLQLDLMQDIIDYQLQSATAVGRQRFAKPISIRKQTEQIISSLQKLHAEKNLTTRIEIAEKTQFFGDEGDWMEVVGNLLDNAFKWADSMVAIQVVTLADASGQSHRHGVKITVEDDGQGISAEQKELVLKRGMRLDSQTPGHGLGMHIVKGIVDMYDGDIEVETRSPKGTRFIVTLN